MPAIAGDVDLVSRVLAELAAVPLVIYYRAPAGWMRTLLLGLLDIGHRN
jgi:hypothetical protein